LRRTTGKKREEERRREKTTKEEIESRGNRNGGIPWRRHRRT
jgi:hypothetical protein